MNFDLIHLNPDTGELGRTPPNGIVNIAGIAGPVFTVHGKALIFADGTLSDGSNAPSILNTTLQNSYSYGSGLIDLSAGKNFILKALNNKTLTFSADTGDVAIQGNLSVQTINGQLVQDLGGNAVKKFEYIQSNPTLEWTVLHNLNSKKINVSLYDESNEQFLGNAIKIVSNNIVKISFNTAQTGRAMLFAA